MNEWNVVATFIVGGIFLLWNLELIATLLNLKSFPEKVPPVLSDIMAEEKLERAREYLRTHAIFGIIQSSAALGVFLAFWALGGFAYLDQFARSLAPQSEVLTGLIFLGILMLGQALLGLPFTIYDTFVIEEKFGFNRATPLTFLTDRLKGLLLAGIIGIPVVAGILWIFGAVPQAWFWAWLMVTVVQLALTYVAPTWIMPLFNKFTPMPEGDLKEKIETLGKRCNFPLTGVFIMDGSKRSTKANAFFTGLGKQKKIALFDTLVEKSTPAEIIGVLAHEIGHFRCGHIKQRLIVGILQMSVIFFLLGLATDPDGKFSRMLFDAFGVRQISTHVGLVLFSIFLEPISKLLGILANAWSRRHEFEADAYAAGVTGDGNSLGEALKRMTSDHLSHPCPSRLRVWLDYSHPPLVDRLRALSGN